MEETVYVQLINKITKTWNGLDYSIVAAEVLLLSEQEAQLSLNWLNNTLSEYNQAPSYLRKYLYCFSTVSLLRSNLEYGSF
jgi:hypothetical protein